MDASEHLSRLKMMANERQTKWDLSPNDVKAIRWAIETIERAEMIRQLDNATSHTEARELIRKLTIG